MFIKNMNIDYSLSLIMSIGKKSFEGLGKTIKKSGDTVRRLLNSSRKSFALLDDIAKNTFKNKKMLILSLDYTLLRKPYSTVMEGVCKFFDTKLKVMMNAYNALIAGLTDGKYFIPIRSGFAFSKEVLPNANKINDNE